MINRRWLVMVELMILIIIIIIIPCRLQVQASMKQSPAAAPEIVLPGCNDYLCGNISIPYPFGLGPKCFHNPWFEVVCNLSFGSPKPFLKKLNLQVTSFPFSTSPQYTVSVSMPPQKICGNGVIHSIKPVSSIINLTGTPFRFSRSNIFTVEGCKASVVLMNSRKEIMAGCASVCPNHNYYDSTLPLNSIGVGGCQSLISYRYDSISYESYQIGFSNGTILDQPTCINASVSETAGNYSDSYPTTILDWYLDAVPKACEGCTPSSYKRKKGLSTSLAAIIGLGAGVGAIHLGTGCCWLYHLLRRRKEIRQRAKNFRRNGGLLLQKERYSEEGVILDKSKIFTMNELEEATDHFNEDRILGQGGQGTVYKGMLIDGQIVAVKKSKQVDENQLEQFANELVILTRINHRNVVKLLGCCLETQVPTMVYEFIANGTLYEHIHHPSDGFRITWKTRVQIAVETATALTYLHSSSSTPIYHRDIKSSNILLDDKYRAKVSDFGASRTITIEHTHLTASVHGTFGYLDPEYFQSNQYTEKSDVYSFGVVLAELLTSRKPVYANRPTEWRSLVREFLFHMENSRLLEILDDQILQEGKEEEILTVANLAQRCLNLNGKQRPTMRQVGMVLEGVRYSSGHHVLTSVDNHGVPSSDNIVIRRTDQGTGAGALDFNTFPLGSQSPDHSIDIQPLLLNTL
ncbi:hypothetical protein Dimus_021366 [Dionaea muscipula]